MSFTKGLCHRKGGQLLGDETPFSSSRSSEMEREDEGGDVEDSGGGQRPTPPQRSDAEVNKQEVGLAEKVWESKCGGGWLWGKQRKNLRLPMAAIASKTADLAEVVGKEDGYVEKTRSEPSDVRRKEANVELHSVERIALFKEKEIGNIATMKSPCGAEQECSVVSKCSGAKSVKDCKVYISTAFSMTSLFKISSRLNSEKKEIVQSIGLGSLLRMPDFKMFPRQIVLWLLSNMDSVDGAIKLRNGELLPFSARDVAVVLGISSKGKDVLGEEVDYEATDRQKNSVLMLRTGEEPNLKNIEAILLKDYGRLMTKREREQFKLAFVLYVEAFFLGAKGKIARVNNEIFKKCSDTTIISQMGWADYVVRCLKDSAKKVQLSLVNRKQHITIEGCLYFLLLFYLDNLDFGVLNANRQVKPRYKAYSCELVRNMVYEDKIEDTESTIAEFGHTKLRSHDEVVYSRTGEHQSVKWKEQDDSNLDEAVTEVVNKMNNWFQSVKALTAKTETEMLDCLRHFRNDEQLKKTDARMQTCTSTKRTDGDGLEVSGAVLKTPMHNKEPVCINLETPEGEVAKCSGWKSGSGLKEYFYTAAEIRDTQIMGGLASTKKDIPVVPYVSPVTGLDENDWDYDGLSSCQRIRRESSYDGMTNSEDSRLCYGLSGYPEPPTDYKSLSCELDKETELEQQLYLDIEKFDPFGGTKDSQSKHPDTTIAGHNTETCEEMHESPGLVKGGEKIESDIILYNDGKTGLVEMFEGIGRHIVTLCGEEFDGGSLRSNSIFGLSPFAIDLTHRDAPLGSVVRLYFAIRNCTDDDKESTWFKHNHPHEIEIKGWELQLMFASINDFSKNVVSAIVRMFHTMDDELFSVFKEKRFRHFLPPEFGDIVLSGTGVADNDSVREMFIADHVSYAVAECKLILLPVCIDSNWSLYIWNFERRTIVVIDPVKMIGGSVAVKRKHEEYVDKLHEAITICKDKWFKCPGVLMVGWAKEFLSVEGAHGNRFTSGLYTMFYARYFDGMMLTRILTYESQDMQKCNILHQMLSLPDNVGEVPYQIRTTLMPAT